MRFCLSLVRIFMAIIALMHFYNLLIVSRNLLFEATYYTTRCMMSPRTSNDRSGKLNSALSLPSVCTDIYDFQTLAYHYSCLMKIQDSGGVSEAFDRKFIGH